MLMQILTVCSDLSLGLIAYNMTRKLDAVQKQQAAILDALVRRVEILEGRKVGF